METNPHILGCLLGTAVGDAIGLPREGLSRRRARRIFGPPPLQHAFLGRRGMCSDDTEHTVMVAQAYLAAAGDADRFARNLAWRMRWWFLRLPAGVGLATLRACLKLWLGFPPTRSGVWSAGNGPAMRSAILGIVAETDVQLAAFVTASTVMTHTDPRATQGALIIAQAARWGSSATLGRGDIEVLRSQLLASARDTQLRSNMAHVFDGVAQGEWPEQIADALGLSRGVTGYINHTVPMAVGCWLAHRQDGENAYRAAVESAVALGGDSDTVAAITGALAGAEHGADAIPLDWLAGLSEWPTTKRWIASLADALTRRVQGESVERIPRVNAFAVLLRNVGFTAIVLAQGLRRLLPPY